jgi:hypothetical protein
MAQRLWSSKVAKHDKIAGIFRDAEDLNIISTNRAIKCMWDNPDNADIIFTIKSRLFGTSENIRMALMHAGLNNDTIDKDISNAYTITNIDTSNRSVFEAELYSTNLYG